MIEIKTEAEFRCTPERIFEYMADTRNEFEWNAQVKAMEKISGGEVTLGTRFRGNYDKLGPMDIEITEFNKPSRLDFKAVSKPLDMNITIGFTPTPVGTKMQLLMSMKPKGIMKVIAPFIKSKIITD